MINNKISWYFEKKNSWLGDNVLAICYNADSKEIKENYLTSNTILILVKNSEFSKYINVEDFNLIKCLEDSFKDKILLRIQCECLLGTYGDLHCDCEQQKKEALNLIKKRGGIFIHLPQEAQGHGLQYKLKELELQVNGRDNSGKYIGHKNRNEAQKILLKNENFEDKRAYSIIKNIISENELEGVNVYIKRMPNIENHIMDVYGKKDAILNFIKRITKVSDKTMLSMISNIQLEEDDYDYNLSFADENAAIEEELAIFKLLNNED